MDENTRRREPQRSNPRRSSPPRPCYRTPPPSPSEKATPRGIRPHSEATGREGGCSRCLLPKAVITQQHSSPLHHRPRITASQLQPPPSTTHPHSPPESSIGLPQSGVVERGRSGVEWRLGDPVTRCNRRRWWQWNVVPYRHSGG